ncbi:MAG TPA: exosortase/archaeosortase family protein [Patescibacteria group bacterium]|nr:exosortase/archaeosortase family protein [Patescibacteria group bacterium]
MSHLNQKYTFQSILLVFVFLLMILPFFVTFQEFLTFLLMKVSLYRALQETVVPFETALTAGLLRFFSIEARAYPSSITFLKQGEWQTFTIAWNCVGWQSFVLLGISLVTGLQGNYPALSKIVTILFGLSGTFLVTIARLFLVFVFAYFSGPVVARVFHDYFATIMMVIWLLFFWWFSFRFLLHKPGEEQAQQE